jgi:hypothetical protein
MIGLLHRRIEQKSAFAGYQEGAAYRAEHLCFEASGRSRTQ